MKLTITSLKELGLDELMQGTLMRVPSCFYKQIDLLFENSNQMIAFTKHRYLNDYRLMGKVMILLNRLVRYYQKPIILYCISYQALLTGEKNYLTFKKEPFHKEN